MNIEESIGLKISLKLKTYLVLKKIPLGFVNFM